MPGQYSTWYQCTCWTGRDVVSNSFTDRCLTIDATDHIPVRRFTLPTTYQPPRKIYGAHVDHVNGHTLTRGRLWGGRETGARGETTAEGAGTSSLSFSPRPRPPPPPPPPPSSFILLPHHPPLGLQPPDHLLTDDQTFYFTNHLPPDILPRTRRPYTDHPRPQDTGQNWVRMHVICKLTLDKEGIQHEGTLTAESPHNFAFQLGGHRLTQLFGNICCYIFG